MAIALLYCHNTENMQKIMNCLYRSIVYVELPATLKTCVLREKEAEYGYCNLFYFAVCQGHKTSESLFFSS